MSKSTRQDKTRQTCKVVRQVCRRPHQSQPGDNLGPGEAGGGGWKPPADDTKSFIFSDFFSHQRMSIFGVLRSLWSELWIVAACKAAFHYHSCSSESVERLSRTEDARWESFLGKLVLPPNRLCCHLTTRLKKSKTASLFTQPLCYSFNHFTILPLSSVGQT